MEWLFGTALRFDKGEREEVYADTPVMDQLNLRHKAVPDSKLASYLSKPLGFFRRGGGCVNGG